MDPVSVQVTESRSLTPGLLSAASPRFSPDGRTLLFMSHEAAAATGVHAATASLHAIDWPPPGDSTCRRFCLFSRSGR